MEDPTSSTNGKKRKNPYESSNKESDEVRLFSFVGKARVKEGHREGAAQIAARKYCRHLWKWGPDLCHSPLPLTAMGITGMGGRDLCTLVC